MKYVIDIEDKPEGGLYKATAFRTLVFDREGLSRLKPLEAPLDAYERGKRDALLLLKQKMVRQFEEGLTELMNEVPKGWL